MESAGLQKLAFTSRSLLDDAEERVCHGVLLLALVVCIFLSWTFLIVSKAFPPFSHPTLLYLQEDQFFCYLFPLSIPICVITCHLNWTGLKLFRHG